MTLKRCSVAAAIRDLRKHYPKEIVDAMEDPLTKKMLGESLSDKEVELLSRFATRFGFRTREGGPDDVEARQGDSAGGRQPAADPMDAYMAAVRRVRSTMVSGGFASDDEEDAKDLNLEPSSDEDEDEPSEPAAAKRRTA
eukprot:s3203_g11.t1